MKLTQIMNNFHELQHKGTKLWFSYETPIAIQRAGRVYISENQWGRATGKHINYVKNSDITTHGEQVPHEELLSIIDIYV